MRQRRSEAIWIESRKRWQINVQRDCRRRTFTSSTSGKKGKHEAEAKADRWLQRFTTEQTIDSAIDLYLEDVGRHIKPSTFSQYKIFLNAYVRAYFPLTKRLSAITEYDWQKVVECSGMNKASSQKYLIGLLKRFVEYCESRRWEVEPIRNLHTTDDATASKQKRALTKAQLAKLLSLTTEDNHLCQYFQLLVLTGCRKSEMADLQWKDVMDDSIRIVRGKTANASRVVPLMEQARAIINDIRSNATVISGYVFHDEFGERIKNTVYNYQWDYHVSKLIGAEDYTIHELRHTYISICKASVPTVLLKQAVGHSASMDTIGVYGHTTEQDVVETAEASEKAFENVLK